MKYVPCNSTQCIVTVIAQSDQCASCSIPFTRQLRMLQAIPSQSSTITFEIQSTVPLNEDVVTLNLNSNIANANKDSSTVNPPFEIKSNFVSSTSQPTAQPTTPLPTPRPSQGSKSGKSTSGGGKSSKGPKEPKGESSYWYFIIKRCHNSYSKYSCLLYCFHIILQNPRSQKHPNRKNPRSPKNQNRKNPKNQKWRRVQTRNKRQIN